jgi:hypothetical protein
MGTGRTTSIHRRWFRCVGVGACVALLLGCARVLPSGSLESAPQQHRCTAVEGAEEIDGADVVSPQGNAVCEARALGGDGNSARAGAEGEGSEARAVAGSLDLFDNGTADKYLASDDNTSLALATNGAGALARSGVNGRGKEGAQGNTAFARADRPGAFADASAANGSHNAATSVAEGCLGEPGQACAFSAAGNGDDNVVMAVSEDEGSKAQAGALDGDRNTAVSKAADAGRAFGNAQTGDDNNASSIATGEGAFAASQSTGGGSFAQSLAKGADSTAGATAQKGGAARAVADDGATATATASGSGFTAMAVASGAGASASATHNADTDTGNCSGPGVAFAMTGGSFHCVQGF